MIRNFIRSLLFGKAVQEGYETKSSAVSLGSNTPVYPTRNFYTFAKEGYSRNEVVYACINMIATTLASAPLQVIDKDKKVIDNHPLTVLMNRPNPQMSEASLMEMSCVHLHCGGDTYLRKIKTGLNQVAELWVIRPDKLVKIIPDQYGLVDKYVFSINGEEKKLDRDEIIHIKLPNPLNDYFGLSPIEAALKSVATDIEASDFSKVLLQNGAIPGMVVTTQEEKINKEKADRYRELWHERFSGEDRGKILFLGRGMDIKSVAFSMKDMTFNELRNIMETRICMSIGVNPILIGAESGLKNSTYANYQQARQSFQEETMQPMQRRYTNAFENDINFKVLPGEKIIFDMSNVTALSNIKYEEHKDIREAFEKGILTRDEARIAYGYEPTDQKDEKPKEKELNVEKADKEKDKEKDEKQDEKEVKSKNVPKIETKIRSDHENKRISYAEKHYPKAITILLELFRQIEKDVMNDVMIEKKSLSETQITTLLKKIDKYGKKWTSYAIKMFQPIINEILNGGITLAKQELVGSKIDMSFALGTDEIQKAIKDHSFKFAEGIAQSSQDEIKALMIKSRTDNMTMGELKKALKEKFANWQDVRQKSSRVNAIAHTETIRASNEGARLQYMEAGIKKIRWKTTTAPCPYCSAMDNVVISIEKPFFEKGDSFQPDDELKPMVMNYENVAGPPLHVNCQCITQAVIE